MSNIFGQALTLSIFGESHGKAVGMTIDGLPAGFLIDFTEIQRELNRRAPGNSVLDSTRKEDDVFEILSGILHERTTGAPLCFIIENKDPKSEDYEAVKDCMRPGHGDYPARVRYGGYADYRGGGHNSGRLTAPLVFCGALCKQLLRKEGIAIGAHIKQIGRISDVGFDTVMLRGELLESLTNQSLPLLDRECLEGLKAEILHAKADHDSVGGIIECAATGVPAGLGEPFFDSVESTLASLLFSIPAVKAVEFGLGFDFASKRGSQCIDPYYYDESGQVRSKCNHNGGVLGGMTTGMPVVFRVAIKPTPSIGKEQDTVNVREKKDVKLIITGRHDPCIVPRALPVVESALAIGLYQCLRGKS